MINSIYKILLVSGALAIPLSANAVLIDPGTGYTRDSASNIVIGGGLEWLKWDETVGQSISTALANYAPAGWRLATNTEMAALYNAFNFGITFDTEENTFQAAQFTWGVLEESIATQFVNLYSTTYTDVANSDPADPLKCACVFYGADADGDNFYNIAQVFDDYTWTGVTPHQPQPGVAGLYEDQWTQNTVLSAYGVALVKVEEVPEPATIALFALGLLGLGFNRRHQRQVPKG